MTASVGAPGDRWSRVAAFLGAAVGAMLVVLGNGFVPLSAGPGGSPSAEQACLHGVTLQNSTAVLGGAFRAGGIWGQGANSTGVLLGGTSLYVKATDLNRPALLELLGNRSGSVGVNLTSEFEPYFTDGGIYAATWNGTAWLIGGQADFDGTPGPSLVSWSGAAVANLTPRISSYFVGLPAPGQSSPPDWGIWATEWNGSAWLVAGNGSRGAVLLALEGNLVTDLTPELGPSAARGYITLIDWNSTAWMVGGFQVFGTYSGGRFTDLLPNSSFASSGVFAADWNGTGWLVGGGSPPALATLRGDRLAPGPALPASFRGAWVNSIAALPSSAWAPSCSGWLVAGLGLVGSGQYTAALALWQPSDPGPLVDLTAELPSSFLGGEVEDVGWAPSLGPATLVLSGQGSLSLATGASVGALAVLTLSAVGSG